MAQERLDPEVARGVYEDFLSAYLSRRQQVAPAQVPQLRQQCLKVLRTIRLLHEQGLHEAEVQRLCEADLRRAERRHLRVVTDPGQR